MKNKFNSFTILLKYLFAFRKKNFEKKIEFFFKTNKNVNCINSFIQII